MMTIFIFISVNSFGQVEITENTNAKSEILSNIGLEEFTKGVNLEKKNSVKIKISQNKLTPEQKAIRYKEELPACAREEKVSFKTL